MSYLDRSPKAFIARCAAAFAERTRAASSANWSQQDFHSFPEIVSRVPPAMSEASTTFCLLWEDLIFMLAPVPQSTVTLATCRCFVVLSHSPKAYRSLQSTYVLRKDPCRTRCGNRSPPARKESPCHFTIPQQQAIEATSGRSEEESPDRKAASSAHSPVRPSPATNSKITL